MRLKSQQQWWLLTHVFNCLIKPIAGDNLVVAGYSQGHSVSTKFYTVGPCSRFPEPYSLLDFNPALFCWRFSRQTVNLAELPCNKDKNCLQAETTFYILS